MSKEIEVHTHRSTKNGNDSQRDDKGELMSSSRQYLDDLEVQLSELKSKFGTFAKGAALVGGIIILGYSLYKIFLEEEVYFDEGGGIPEQNAMVETSSTFNQSPVVKMIMEMIALFIISIAKQKIKEYIKKLDTEIIEIEDEEDISAD